MRPGSIRPLRTITVGEGHPLVILHGYAMQPETYLPLANLLADRVQVVIPAIFDLRGPWHFKRVVAALQTTLDRMNLERVSLLGHSFGGGLELGLAAGSPGRVIECVFGDTLAVHARFQLAGEAMRHPLGLLGMATRPAIDAFVHSWATRPVELTTAALWGFLSERGPEIDRIMDLQIPCHVLWASRDSLLARSDGEDFARMLNASFTVAPVPGIDHDWMFDDPDLFATQLMGLGLKAFDGETSAEGSRS